MKIRTLLVSTLLCVALVLTVACALADAEVSKRFVAKKFLCASYEVTDRTEIPIKKL